MGVFFMAKVVVVGSKLKPITLENHMGNEISLPCCHGKKILLSFHPLAWTGICTKQMELLDSLYDNFEASGIVSFGISVDAAPSKKAWADSMGLKKLQLLCDFWPHGALADSLDLFDSTAGISARANVIIDESGGVAFLKEYPIAELPDFNELFSFLKK